MGIVSKDFRPLGVLSSIGRKVPALGAGGFAKAKAEPGHYAVGLGCGVVWVCCPTAEPSAAAIPSLAGSVVKEAELTPGGPGAETLAASVEGALRRAAGVGGPDGRSPTTTPPVSVLVPETMPCLEMCRWNGDGHFNYSKYQQKAPVPLGHLVSFLRMVEASAEQSAVTVHLSSRDHIAEGALLAGAVLVLLRGLTAKSAWVKIQKGCPSVGSDPAKAWDRFPPPFSGNAVTTASSLTVLDCLAGLEAARDLGWFDYEAFDVGAWRAMRRKFDASWVIPGEILAMGEPSTTSLNPAYPGLLGPAGKTHKPSIDSDTGSDASTAASACEQTPSFLDLFAQHGISRVMRLNRKHESRAAREVLDCEEVFRQAGVELEQHDFEDGTAPTLAVANNFVKAVAGYNGAIAVHCMQGLGRTGAMTGAYAIAQHNISGEAYHGWVRMCRPGSIQTTQQERFLRGFQKRSSGLSL